jgi:serine/threonine protein kinase
VKGDNVLVRRSDGRAMLIDFGTGLYPEAETLTPPDAYPGTPAYRSPESALFELQSLRTRAERYRAGPSDELYALGVTACRWLTGEYPRFSEPERNAQGLWRMEAVEVPRALEQVAPVLRDPVRRLLSVRPEERGTVAQLAEGLERTTRPTSRVAVRAVAPPPPATSPEVKHRGTEGHPGENPSSASVHPQTRTRRVWPWLATAVSGLVVAAWVGGRAVGALGESFSVHSSEADRADAGTAGLGETVSATSSAMETPESSLPVMADETLPEPLPGQTRPDAKGHCPHQLQVALNGACWVPFAPGSDECAAFEGQLFRGRCYVPALPRKRPSTAHPPLKP